MSPWVVLVGGFLGAGKTTLIMSAARLLRERGFRPAVVTNDQGDDLVDTAFVRREGIAAEEVTGGCFCCRYEDLVETIGKLEGFDVVFAEPVGSCTDLAATVLQPLYRDGYRLAPFTVVVDPTREIAGAEMEFLYTNQVAEADLVCVTRADLVPESPVAGRRVSGLTGEGVAEWLDEILSGTLTPGTHALDLDYERYAAAETALSWLDLRAIVEPGTPVSPAMLAGPLLDRLDQQLNALHMKLVCRADTGFVKAAIAGKGTEPQAEGDLTASPSNRLELLLNIRALDAPEVLEAAVRESLPPCSELRLRCFRPQAPVRRERC